MNNFLHQRSVEAKGRRDEENGLFIPREWVTSSVENFREVPKVYDNYVKYFAQESFAYRIIRWQVINPMQKIKKLTFDICSFQNLRIYSITLVAPEVNLALSQTTLVFKTRCVSHASFNLIQDCNR